MIDIDKIVENGLEEYRVEGTNEYHIPMSAWIWVVNNRLEDTVYKYFDKTGICIVLEKKITIE